MVEAFDAITVFDAIHDQVDPARVLANIHRALRPGGVLLMVDIKASSNLEDNVEIPWAVTVLHDLDDALHDRVAIGGRGGAGHNVGSTAGNQRCWPRPDSAP